MLRYKQSKDNRIMSFISNLIRNKQTGDTIVEVVIAIAVIAVVLTGAFIVTNHSLTSVRDSEEHSEALNLLQGQVEQLRNAVNQSTITPADIANGFCFLSNGSIQEPVTAACVQNTLYKLSIQQCNSSECPPSGLSTVTYLLTASWNSLNSGLDQVQLTYSAPS